MEHLLSTLGLGSIMTRHAIFHAWEKDKMLENVNYGIVGCGMMGQEHIRNVALIDGAEIIAYFEPDAEMRRTTAGIIPEARAADSIPDLLAIDDLDALIIASPNHCHAAQLAEITL